MQTFDDRLKFQKRIYLLQELFGVPFGYSFGWYIRGPYSSELAHDGFRNESISQLAFKAEQKEIVNKKEDEVGLQQASKFFENVDEFGIGEEKALELLSSLHFMKINWFPTADCNTLVAQLMKSKPNFKKPEVEQACAKLDQLMTKH